MMIGSREKEAESAWHLMTTEGQQQYRQDENSLHLLVRFGPSSGLRSRL
jgi:hypothetical protein